jgi:hypothetical protein
MSSVDADSLAATTNLIRDCLIKAATADGQNDPAEALRQYQTAITAACQMMTDLVAPNYERWSEEIAKQDMKLLRPALENPDQVRAFLLEEEKLLKGIGLHPTLVHAVMERCIDYTESPPREWDDRQLRAAFEAAKFRVCDSAAKELAASASDLEDRFRRRRIGRAAFRTAVGITIIVADYNAFGPVEFFGVLSVSYGLSWLPTWPLSS